MEFEEEFDVPRKSILVVVTYSLHAYLQLIIFIICTVEAALESGTYKNHKQLVLVHFTA